MSSFSDKHGLIRLQTWANSLTILFQSWVLLLTIAINREQSEKNKQLTAAPSLLKKLFEVHCTEGFLFQNFNRYAHNDICYTKIRVP